MRLLKEIFKPLFATELARLESCEAEIRQCAEEYADLEANYYTLAAAVADNKPIIPRDFADCSEMEAWFLKNQLDKKEYVKDTHDCDDFAIETQQAALRDGYIVNLELDHKGAYYENGVGHMLCGCRVGNMYYIIEPQSPGCRIVYETRLD